MPKILKSISSISEKIGEVNANHLSKQSPQLRKQNQIHSFLQIEGKGLKIMISKSANWPYRCKKYTLICLAY